jgi:hypothetical protein
VKQIRAILLLLVAWWALAACQLVEQRPLPDAEEPSAPGTGALYLRVLSAARTLSPSVVMEIASFDIRGSGPDPVADRFEELGVANTGEDLAVSGLRPGEWTITVDARNPPAEGDPNPVGIVIGRGVTAPPVTITAGSATSASILIMPLPGDGTLELTLTWRKNTMNDGTLKATLTSSGGAPVTLTFSLTSHGNVATAYTKTALSAGYYLLTLRVTRDDGSVWGTAEAVRIIAGQTTSETYPLD